MGKVKGSQAHVDEAVGGRQKPTAGQDGGAAAAWRVDLFFHTKAIFLLSLLVLHIFPAFHVSLEEVGHVGEVTCGRNGAVLDPVAAAAAAGTQVGCCGQDKEGTADLRVRAEELF